MADEDDHDPAQTPDDKRPSTEPTKETASPSEEELRNLFRRKTRFSDETANLMGVVFLDDFQPTPISRGVLERMLGALRTELKGMQASCFLSYSSADQSFAEKLHSDLLNAGVHCWFAPHDVRGGRKLHQQIEEGIRKNDRLLLILSEASMRSEWVKTEIAFARHREIEEKRQILFPLSLVSFAKIREWRCFDADTGKDSAREIREYFIPDFSKWNDDSTAYEMALTKLVQDLSS